MASSPSRPVASVGPVASVVAGGGAARSSSVRRIAANHSSTHTRPTAPITWNANRQLPMSSVMSQSMSGGVTIAPTDAPLWSTLLPIVRSFACRRAKVVFSAQGQCPASKNPSRTRQPSSDP